MKHVFSAAPRIACMLLVFVLLFVSMTWAATSPTAEVLEYGLYTYDNKVVVVEEQSSGAAKLSNIRHLKTTLDIPILKNNFFSIKYVINTDKPGQVLEIELRVTTPDGKVSTGKLKAVAGNVTITNIEFTETDNPGEYVLEVLHKNQVLFTKNINVIRQ